MDSRLEALDYSADEYRELFSTSPLESQSLYWLGKLTDVYQELGLGCNAWSFMFADDDRTRVEGQSRGFDVGVSVGIQIAAAVLKDPLGDPLPAIRSALERAVKQYRWYENEAKK